MLIIKDNERLIFSIAIDKRWRYLIFLEHLQYDSPTHLKILDPQS